MDEFTRSVYQFTLRNKDHHHSCMPTNKLPAPQQQQIRLGVCHSWACLGWLTSLLCCNTILLLHHSTILLCQHGAIFYLHWHLADRLQGLAFLCQYWLWSPPHPLNHVLHLDIWGQNPLLQDLPRLKVPPKPEFLFFFNCHSL